MERRLKTAGYEVSTYSSAQALLDRLPIDTESGCILLDVRIPGLSGPQLQDRLGELGFSLPIVFLTGHADVQTTVRVIKAGAEHFLTKPVASEDLLAAVERAFGAPQRSCVSMVTRAFCFRPRKPSGTTMTTKLPVV